MLRRTAVNATLLLASLAAALALAEAILRLIGQVPARGLHSVSAKDFARIPGFWEPHQDFVNRKRPELPHKIHINSLGLRGPETTRAPRGPRVLCLGDSFTFGEFVNDEQTLPAHLSARLPAPVEVLNAGVLGTTIVDQSVFLPRFLELAPTLVLLIFCDNDLEDLLKTPPLHVRYAQNRQLKSGLGQFVYVALRNTSLFSLYLRYQALTREHQAAADVAADPVPRLRELAREYARHAAHLRQYLGGRGIELLLATFPSAPTLTDYSGSDRVTLVLAALHTVGIEAVDLMLPLRQSGLSPNDIYLFPHDGHPSPQGYAVAAKALVPHVQSALLRASRGEAHIPIPASQVPREDR
jgi:lysophospholipase L1-like esterase